MASDQTLGRFFPVLAQVIGERVASTQLSAPAPPVGVLPAGPPERTQHDPVALARGGNAVDAAVAMLAATCTMWDTLGWGGETQALEAPGAVDLCGLASAGASQPELFTLDRLDRAPATLRGRALGPSRP